MSETPLKYLRNNLGMTAQEFMQEWKLLTSEEKESLKQDARDEAKALGIELVG